MKVKCRPVFSTLVKRFQSHIAFTFRVLNCIVFHPQVNMMLENDPNYPVLGLDWILGDPGTIVPAFWLDENSALDQASKDELKTAIYGPAKIALGLTIGLGIVGGLLVFAAGLFCIFKA